MSKLFNSWIARLDAWEARVTDFPNYPGWLSVFAGVTFAVAGASLILALGFLILISLVPGLSTLIQPLQPLGEVLAAIVAGLMILAIILFLLFDRQNFYFFSHLSKDQCGERQCCSARHFSFAPKGAPCSPPKAVRT